LNLKIKIRLFFEDEINGQHKESKAYGVIPAEGLAFEEQQRKAHEHRERDHFLDHFELDETEGTAVFPESEPVCRHLEKIFEERNSPADEHDADQSEVLKPFHFLEFEMSVPGEGHEGV